jgi:hypothetical protein
MTAIVPDTLQGALIVSVIDFFLSFVIISGIGVVLALFPLLNRLAQFRIGAQPAAATGHDKSGPSSGKAVIPDKGGEMVDQDDIAAIAAAVLVVMDGTPHRILHIEPSQRSGGWVSEGRVAHHGSHIPKS